MLILEIIIGFSGGFAVGGGFVAILTVLGIIPRLIQLSHSQHLIKAYGACVILGTLFGTYLSFTEITWNHSLVVLIFWGLFHGVFNGMVAAALTEVLNVFPIISRRIRVEGYLLLLLMAFVFGKIFGSLYQWLFFVK